MARLMRRFAPPMMSKHKVKPNLQVFSDSDLLARAAAEAFTVAAAEAVASRGRFLVTLSGGSTPQAMFSLLAEPTYRLRIDWTAVHVFWGDERLVPADDRGSNYYYAQHLLLAQVPIPASQVYRVRGELPPNEAVEDYRRQLQSIATGRQAWPRFDLALMGLGADGHTASLFPGAAAISEKTRSALAVTADYAGRPAQRITLTPPVFNDARQVLFLVSGKEKAKALAAVLGGPRDIQKWPAQSIQPASHNLTWFVDRPAAERLNPS